MKVSCRNKATTMDNFRSFALVAYLSILICICNCSKVETSNKKTLYSEKLKELWLNRADKSMDFYDFLEKEMLPQDTVMKLETDSQIPAEFFSNTNFKGSNFPCKVFHNRTKPKSVHRLRPSDVDVVAAMGDSITAAFGAKSRNILEIFCEFRGISWSIGGDKTLADVVTLPNILKEYNAKVDGFSVKTTPPKIRIPWRAHLNYAVSGAISSGLPAQAEKLIKDLKSRKDYKDSWKVLTLWIGGNDLCAYCKNDKHTLDKYVAGIRDALDMFHKEVPKMFVNLVQILDVTRLADINSAYCKPLHYVLCYCGTSDGEATKKKVSAAAVAYQQGVDKLIGSGRYDTRDDFTVVIQPFFEQTKTPRNPDGSVDMSYFAPDCFHFSEVGHRSAALALWNSMIEPVGKKRKSWSKGEKFECPSDKFPYFYTNKNSKEISEEPSSFPSVYRAVSEFGAAEDESPSTSTTKEKSPVNLTAIFACVSLLVALTLAVVVVVLKRRERRTTLLNVQDTDVASYNSF